MATIGYSRSATPNSTFIRFGFLDLNGDGGQMPPGFVIGGTYQSLGQLNFEIQAL